VPEAGACSEQLMTRFIIGAVMMLLMLLAVNGAQVYASSLPA